MLNYLQRHWRGQQSLGWSFWVNLVGIRVMVFMLQNAAAPAEGGDHQQYRTLVLIAVVVFHLVLLIWQLVGVIRAAETHYSENGNMALVWGVQLASVLMFMLSAVYSLGAVQMTSPVPEALDTFAMMEKEHASQYAMQVSKDGDVLNVTGSIELGITRAVKKLLASAPTVATVVLESDGGNIYEGRGLAKLFSEHKLATHVSATCASACTVAFAGGRLRTADPKAAFGFHQYRVDADYTIIATDVEKEQKRDQQLFLDAGVSDAFVQTVFSQPSMSMWWTGIDELLHVGFVHRIVSHSDGASSTTTR